MSTPRCTCSAEDIHNTLLAMNTFPPVHPLAVYEARLRELSDRCEVHRQREPHESESERGFDFTLHLPAGASRTTDWRDDNRLELLLEIANEMFDGDVDASGQSATLPAGGFLAGFSEADNLSDAPD